MKDIIQYCQRRNRVFIYGAGEYARFIYAFLYEQGISINAFVVSCQQNQECLYGKKIYTINEYAPEYSIDDALIIGVGEKAHEEIITTLRQSGISNYISFTDCYIRRMESMVEYILPVTSLPICVLCYHRITEPVNDIWNLCVPPDVFEEQIIYLKETYNIARFNDDWSNITKPTVVLTFDDGYHDSYENLLPILEKHEVPATIFICTGNLNTEYEFWWDEIERLVFSARNQNDEIIFEGNKYIVPSDYENKLKFCYELHSIIKEMLPDGRRIALDSLSRLLGSDNMGRAYNRSLSSLELRQLATSPYISLGGHTVTHNMLSVENSELQKKEIIDSKMTIEHIIGKSIDTFSYPFGGRDDFSLETVKILKKAGFRRIASAYGGLNSSRQPKEDIRRVGVPGNLTIDDFSRYIRKIFYMCGD